MAKRIIVDTQMRSGNLYDADVHQQKIADMEATRENSKMITTVLIGAVAFVVMAIVMALSN